MKSVDLNVEWHIDSKVEKKNRAMGPWSVTGYMLDFSALPKF